MRAAVCGGPDRGALSWRWEELIFVVAAVLFGAPLLDFVGDEMRSPWLGFLFFRCWKQSPCWRRRRWNVQCWRETLPGLGWFAQTPIWAAVVGRSVCSACWKYWSRNSLSRIKKEGSKRKRNELGPSGICWKFRLLVESVAESWDDVVSWCHGFLLSPPQPQLQPKADSKPLI